MNQSKSEVHSFTYYPLEFFLNTFMLSNLLTTFSRLTIHFYSGVSSRSAGLFTPSKTPLPTLGNSTRLEGNSIPLSKLNPDLSGSGLAGVFLRFGGWILRTSITAANTSSVSFLICAIVKSNLLFSMSLVF